MLDRTPKVFISYSWSSEEYQAKIVAIAERLQGTDGVEVKLDVWDLHDGYDKYKFMEQCVNDPAIDHVLIFCDKKYAEKADARADGVGNETTIISAEIYGCTDQEKFIPVIMEHDENGEPYLPAYLKSRMYKDLTGDNFEKGYESLLRTIYQAPAIRKPELGRRPTWLEDTPQEVIRVKQAALRLSGQTRNKELAVKEFVDEYIQSMKPYYKENYKRIGEGEKKRFEFLDNLERLKEQRDILLDFARDIVLSTDTPGSFFGDMMERIYNALNDVHTYKPEAASCSSRAFDIFKYHCWELFICLTALLLHYEKYSDIRDMLCRTYFLNENELAADPKPNTYLGFYDYNETIENIIKPETETSSLYTLSGDLLCRRRQYEPIYTADSIARADLFLYQVYPALEVPLLDYFNYWFPVCYVYAEHDKEWTKLVSRKYCEKLYLLFGVKSLDELKGKIAKCVPDQKIGYHRGYGGMAPAILNYVEVADIGMYP